MDEKVVYILIPTTVERRERLAECIASIHQNAQYPHVICTYENYREGFVGPIHRILSGLKESTLVMCIGDDTLFTTPMTLKHLVERYMHEFPDNDGVAQPNDMMNEGKLITMPLCSAETMRRYTHKGYFLNYADREFTEIMKGKKKYLYCPEIEVDHKHWRKHKKLKDSTYEYADTRVVDDKDLFDKRKAQGFPQ